MLLILLRGLHSGLRVGRARKGRVGSGVGFNNNCLRGACSNSEICDATTRSKRAPVVNSNCCNNNRIARVNARSER